jgi:hypothetical protein
LPEGCGCGQFGQDAGDRLGRISGGDGQQQEELVAGQPGGVPAVAGGGDREPLGDRGQQLVAGVMAAAVVDLLELVQVQQGDDGWQLVGGAQVEQPLGVDPVGQTGERVVAGGVGEVGEPDP